MSNKFLKNIKKLQKIRLSKDEKILMRDNLLRFMRTNSEIQENTNLWQRILIKIKSYRPNFLSLRSATALLSVTVILLGSAGVSYAAESSVPGEALYKVKVHLNERFRSAFAQSPEEKSNWELRKVERRFEEAKKLSQKGDLNEEKKEYIQKELKKNRAEIKKLIKEIKAKEAEQIELKLDETIKKHKKDVGEILELEE